MKFITLLITFGILIGGYLWSMSYVFQKRDADKYYSTHFYKATETQKELQANGDTIPLSVIMYHEEFDNLQDWQDYFKTVNPDRFYWSWVETVSDSDQPFLLNLLSIEHDSKHGFNQDP